MQNNCEKFRRRCRVIFVTELRTEGFRNLDKTSFYPSQSFNMITGSNAQGKTSLIEAIWLMTGCRSFRGSKERDCIAIGRNYAEMSMSFTDSFRTQEIYIRLSRNSKEKQILLNGIQCRGGRNLFEQFRCIAFLPSDIGLADGSPEKRRNFMDMCCSQLKPSFLDVIKRYSLIMAHRSALLRNQNTTELAVWNEQLARTGAAISVMRSKYVSLLSLCGSRLYSAVTEGKENLEIKYNSAVYPDDYHYPEAPNSEMIEIYRKKLEDSSDDDLRLGYTQCGIHRDELDLRINKLPVRLYGSQGQKKSCALILKLAQAEILGNEIGEPPVILLDDVMGELDSSRQKLVGRITENMQVFITSCSTGAVVLSDMCSMYCMENGILRQI